MSQPASPQIDITDRPRNGRRSQQPDAGPKELSSADDGELCLKVIVAEDDEGLNMIIRRRLERRGIAVVGVRSGADAIAAVRNHPDCLLLLDYMLPDMEGREVVAQLKAAGRPVPFIVMTGHGDERIAVEMMKLGALDYLVKLPDILELMPPVVERALGELRTEILLNRTEAALREETERAEEYLAVAHVMMVAIDAAGRITMVNPFACEVLGCGREGLVGQSWVQTCIPARLRDEVGGFFGRLLSGTAEQSEYSETPVVASSGTERLIAWHTVVLRDESSTPTGTLSSGEDVTEQRAAEAELARYREHLEELVRARTRDLETVNKELEAFSYSVSHDLRAPLRGINGFAQALQEDCVEQLDSVGRDYIQRIRASSRHMAELIDNLLNLARIARLPLERRPVSLSDLARMLAAELHDTDPARRVEFVVRDDMVVQADPVLAEMVLRNLIDNAWKFTGKHRTGRIEVGETEHKGERLFFVSDDGAGFDMTYVASLSAPFQRLHTTEEFAGTGIGLATVQRILRRHGGRGFIEGAVEQGATYYFTFAAADQGVTSNG